MRHVNSNRRPVATVAGLGLASLTLAACGGSSSSHSNTASTASAASAPHGTTVSRAPGATASTAGGTTASTAPATAPSASGSKSSEGGADVVERLTIIRGCLRAHRTTTCELPSGDSAINEALATYAACLRGAKLKAAQAKCRSELLATAFLGNRSSHPAS